MTSERQEWQPGYWEIAGKDGHQRALPGQLESATTNVMRCALWMKVCLFRKDHQVDWNKDSGSFRPESLSVQEGWSIGRDLFFAFMNLMEDSHISVPPVERQVDDAVKSSPHLQWLKNIPTVARESFPSSLSECQLRSWQLLREWWYGRYQDPVLSSAARAFIRAAPKLDLSSIQPNSSEHQQIFFALWDAEFNPALWTTGTSRGQDANRRMAFEHAMAQKGGFLILNALRPKIIAALQAQEDRQLPKCYDSCPWLNTTINESVHIAHLPLYLWDTSRSQTSKVADLLALGIDIRYTCISHTWGRYEQQPRTLSQVAGVPWPIPEINLYNVTSLPTILAQANVETRFIWVDLFCIPQDPTSQEYVSEVSRQAVIFHNATACMAWFNAVASWENLQDALRWLCLHYLHAGSATDVYNVRGLLNMTTQHSRSVNELIVDSGHFAPWLTSTWTLQESSLCPDITLHGKTWEPLEIVKGTTVSHHQLITLHSVNREAFFTLPTEFRDWPLAAAQLTFIQPLVSGLDVQISRVAILGLGATRTCKRRRADAVMSVMDVTDWYTSYFEAYSVPPPDDDLVLGSYPLNFVKEAATKLGAEFFESFNPQVYQLAVEDICGTLLPFGRPGYDVLSGTGLYHD